MKNSGQSSINLDDILGKIYIVMYVLFIITMGLLVSSSLSVQYTLAKQALYVSYFFCGVSIIFGAVRAKYNFKIFILLGCIALSAVASFFSRDLTIFVDFSIVLGVTRVNFKQMIKADFCARIITLCLILVLFFFNKLQNVVSYRDGVERVSLGFNQPNMLGMFVLVIILEWLYIRKAKIHFEDIAIIMLAAYIIENYSNSRTSLYALGITLIILFLYKLIFMKQRKKVFLSFTAYIVPFFMAISFFCSYFFEKISVINWGLIDDLFSKRLSLASLYLQTYGVKLFGQTIVIVSQQMSSFFNIPANTLDNAYMSLIIKFGFLVCAIFILLEFFFTKYAINSDPLLVIFIMVFAFIGLSETTFYYVEYNFTILGFSLIFGDQESNVNINRYITKG